MLLTNRHFNLFLALSVLLASLLKPTVGSVKPLKKATIEVWMRKGGWRNLSCNDGGALSSLCLAVVDNDGNFVDAPTDAEVTSSTYGWELIDKDTADDYCLPDGAGHCFEMKQLAHDAQKLKVTFEVDNDALPQKDKLKLDFLWEYGCCGWDFWEGNCLNQDNLTNRWIAEVFMRECEASDGSIGELVIKDLNLDSNEDGRIDEMSGSLRWTPYLSPGQNYCNNKEQGFVIILMCEVP